MSQLQKNIIANFAGRGWIAFMALAFVPVYINLMGIEAYGLIGFFTTFQAILSLLDLSLSRTLNRELARFSAQGDKQQEARDMVRTLEGVAWGIAILIGIFTIFIAPFITYYWLQTDQLSSTTVYQAIVIMGFILMLQWPLSFYSGGLMGLQRQVLLNGINVGAATLRSGGAALALWLISPTVITFFCWQALASALHTLLTAFFLWRSLEKTADRPRFRRKLLLSTWKFTAGISAISAIAFILTQTDKIVLSKILTLEEFGYYSLASGVASSLTNLANPLFSALFPYFSALIASNNQEDLSRLYHQGSQLLSIVILPVTAIIVFFSPELLLLWTGNPITVQKSYLLVSVLVIGTAINGIMHIPSALQLAYGWIKLLFYHNLISMLILVPLLFWSTKYYAAMGGAFIWVVLNLGYIFINVPIMHTKLIQREKWRWYIQDVSTPLLFAFSVVAVGYWFFKIQSNVMPILYVPFVYIMALAASALSTPLVRVYVGRFISRGFRW